MSKYVTRAELLFYFAVAVASAVIGWNLGKWL
jgi:hypothetical protein